MREPQSPSFRIRTVALRNFRAFEQATFDFSERFTVVIGGNGSGKSSLLDSLSFLLSDIVVASITGSGLATLSPSDVRQVGYGYGPELSIEPQRPMVLEASVEFDGERIDERWEVESVDRSSFTYDTPLANPFLRQLGERVGEGASETIPLVAHYDTSRLWPIGGSDVDTLPPDSRTSGYDGALGAGSTSRDLVQWFKTRELIALQEGSDLVLQGVKAALRGCMPEWSDVYYSVRHDELIASAGEGSPSMRTFRTLSDGYRNVLAMVADIAKRAATLNPHLGASASLETPGVVLIDELDLHLHPSWQRRIANDLKRTFPAMQFVCTTHSPFIIQSLAAGEALRLRSVEGDPIGGPLPAETFVERGIEDIAEAAMGIEGVERSDRFHEQRAKAKAYFEAAEQADDGASAVESELELMLESLVGQHGEDPYLSAKYDPDADSGRS